MKTVNSFDIFDTLLARTVKTPTDIFDIIETKFPYPNFKNLRTHAQSVSNSTMESIYHQFQLLTGDTDEQIQKLREFELQTEMENTIPIMSNIIKINDGDIFISDMYLSHAEIIRLLNFHNINPNITLYVSPGGKSEGYMYDRLIKEYMINTHTGDNYHSDIEMASRYNINGIYTTIHNFSDLENELIHKNFDLCCFFRKFRLMNPYDENTLEYKLVDQQAKYNIPLLLFMCVKISNILIEEKRNTVLFLSRDGCLIYKLFQVLYPQFNSKYTYSSRIINKSSNEEYVNYLKNIYNENDCLIFDLHGSFESGRDLFMNNFGKLPRIFIFDLSILEKYYDDMTYITNISHRIETFNTDKIGTIIDFKNNKPIHMPTEISTKNIEIIHNTLDQFITYINDSKYKILDDIMNPSSILNNELFWKKYYTDIVIHSELINNNMYIHTERTLTFLSNKYNTDKGDSYKCAHHYTIKYQEIISELLCEYMYNKNTNIVDILEIGLNRDCTDDIPSLKMWNDYFYNNINITGFDISPDFLKFNNKYDNIQIIIGDQSNENDLQKLKYKQYDIIVDDGYHASKHQQISFKTLWSSVKPGGYYIIEDLHYQPANDIGLKTKFLFENWKQNNWIETEYIFLDEIRIIQPDIESIEFYDYQSKLWGDLVKNALVYIKKYNSNKCLHMVN